MSSTGRVGYVGETSSVAGEEYGGFKKKLKTELEELEHEAFGEGGGGLEEMQQELGAGFHTDLSMLEHLPGVRGGTHGFLGEGQRGMVDPNQHLCIQSLPILDNLVSGEGGRRGRRGLTGGVVADPVDSGEGAAPGDAEHCDSAGHGEGAGVPDTYVAVQPGEEAVLGGGVSGPGPVGAAGAAAPGNDPEGESGNVCVVGVWVGRGGVFPPERALPGHVCARRGEAAQVAERTVPEPQDAGVHQRNGPGREAEGGDPERSFPARHGPDPAATAQRGKKPDAERERFCRTLQVAAQPREDGQCASEPGANACSWPTLYRQNQDSDGSQPDHLSHMQHIAQMQQIGHIRDLHDGTDEAATMTLDGVDTNIFTDSNLHLNLSPSADHTISTQQLYEQARQAARPSPSRRGKPTQRRPWSKEEEQALFAGLDQVKGPHWSQILTLYGAGGTISEALKDRNQVQLKDKARNLKLFFLKNQLEVPPYLRFVTGDLKRE
ncbi:hypothetical protein PMAC_002012 [Pneumocystis sp. 'macacae']|nr:hypothetical protein PMAC_002012 [Pneumocystis sp. 'macacae']